ncbi:MAG: N-6 DNA methylase [Treponema berlinense]|uniref:Eco57I restriction-modification methylase domain-containing protein n=1 Tax=Treponema berlinense TaxID=225004 RepID=UPI0023F277FB|nr:N-6 DNA methylase [Treponema berlinense]MDD5833695.1 N-6 DNA methylase [Treponema berlinense]
MILKEHTTEQKLRGAYYTPLLLAEKIAEYFKDDFSLKTMFEPSCGDGVFFDALINKNLIQRFSQLYGIEIEKNEAKKLESRFLEYKNVKIQNTDFFDFYKNNYSLARYDLILGNPPYIRYQYLTEAQRLEMSEILTSHKMKSNKLINTWVAFLVACVHLLSENGKIAFVIPAEILQVAYAEDLRSYLSENLANITLLTFNDLVFPDIEQEIVVLIGKKKSVEKGIRIVEFKNLDDLNISKIKSTEFQPLANTHEKWTKYFTSKAETDLISEIRNDSRFQKLSDCALINVGVTTGNNKYFSVDKTTAEKYDLEEISFPLIGRSSHANSVYFTHSDWEKNVKNDKAAFLVSFPDKPFDSYSKKQKEYIKLGEEKKFNSGYKCSIRGKWYQIPSIWIPDAFFLRRNNLYPKFVLNCCNAISTDTMHRIKFNNNVEPEKIILSYYNSISFAFSELCGRSYGGGVLEILPGEAGNIYIPNLDSIPIEKVRDILRQVDEIVRKNNNIEDALNLVDSEILVKDIGIEKSVCENFRNIWKKLQKRRLSRGQ